MGKGGHGPGGGNRGRYTALATDSTTLPPGKEQTSWEYGLSLMTVLMPYFWPDAGTDGAFINRTRSTLTWVMVIASKGCSIASPLYIAAATNNLVVGDWRNCLSNIITYSSLRFLSSFFKESQSIIYLKVKQQASIQLAETIFSHLHSLSLTWHLNKKMGNVIRSMDRGTSAANQLVTYMFLYLIPALMECLAVCIIFLFHFKQLWIAGVIFLGVAMYIYLTVIVTQWRKKFREASNKHDNEYHEKATDSMINYETVKYFTAEKFEISRFRDSVSSFQKYSVSTQGSMGLLNMIQALIINSTCCIAMILAGNAIIHGNLSIGEFVAVNAYTLAIFAPLSFLGTIYSSIVQGFIDVEHVLNLLQESPDVQDVPNAVPIPALYQYYGKDYRFNENGSELVAMEKNTSNDVHNEYFNDEVVLRCGNCKTELNSNWLYCPYCQANASNAIKVPKYSNSDSKLIDSKIVVSDRKDKDIYSTLHTMHDVESGIELADIELGSNSHNGAVVPSRNRGVGVGVDFKGISFHYPEQPVDKGLKGVTFHVAPGTTTAIVGHTGAGKTTISRLLFRFYDPLSGTIEFNNYDIKQYKQTSVRACVGIVPQDTVLFNDTILYNVQYGRLSATREEVELACKSAHIYDFIMGLPDGWNTVVGERGLKLSGGEKQRVAIARCLLKDPPIVLFDEATSALDTVTEHSIQEALSALGNNRTVVIIAHRLSTIRKADQIIVMDQGSVAERGTHEELLKLNDGYYSKLWNMQLRSHAHDNIMSTDNSEDVSIAVESTIL